MIKCRGNTVSVASGVSDTEKYPNAINPGMIISSIIRAMNANRMSQIKTDVVKKTAVINDSGIATEYL